MDILMMIIWALGLIVSFGVINSASDDNEFGKSGLIGMICGVICIVGLFNSIEDYGYKKGQIDAINGEIKYELVKTKDNSSKWVEIENENN